MKMLQPAFATRPPRPLNRRHALGALAAPLLASTWQSALASSAPAATTVHASPTVPWPPQAECVAPSKPGGGFDLTCALTTQALSALRPSISVQTRYLPGGIGAVAFDQAATGRLGGSGTLVAFSSGSLLNIAQGRFGPHGIQAVRWIATLGTDYGVIAVHQDSPYQTLAQLIKALRDGVPRLVFGAGGTLGSQDWMKAALLARHAGQEPRNMRFVSFEGGGEAIKALQGGHIQAFTGDAAEAMRALNQGATFRLLAVLSPHRLNGRLRTAPTATEQGIALVWPTVRGVYMGAGTPDAVVDAWTAAFTQAHAAPSYAALCEAMGLQPHRLTGAALQAFVQKSVDEYQQLAKELGLQMWKSQGLKQAS